MSTFQNAWTGSTDRTAPRTAALSAVICVTKPQDIARAIVDGSHLAAHKVLFSAFIGFPCPSCDVLKL